MAHKILLIDDDLTNVTLIQNRLQAHHYVVNVAHDGDEGLAAVTTQKPDMIILDVEMPRMNGYTFMTELRKLPSEFQAIPVLVLTAHAEHQPIFGLKRIKGYIVKPIQIEALLEKILKYLGPNVPPDQKPNPA